MIPQGREKDFIILSCVRSNDHQVRSWLLSSSQLVGGFAGSGPSLLSASWLGLTWLRSSHPVTVPRAGQRHRTQALERCQPRLRGWRQGFGLCSVQSIATWHHYHPALLCSK